MTGNVRAPIEYQTEPEYPTLAEAEAYADDFRTGATNAYAKDEKWAKYWVSSELDILTSYLQTNIYAVVSFPPGGFEYASPKEVESLEYFRGWILHYDPVHARWVCLVRSQEVGIDEFKRLRREYKAD